MSLMGPLPPLRHKGAQGHLGGDAPESELDIGGSLKLSHLTHDVAVPGVEERLLICMRDIQLPSDSSAKTGDLRCKVYIGPRACLHNGRPNTMFKARGRQVRLRADGGILQAEVNVGVIDPQEPWSIRLKLYYRGLHTLFVQQTVAEATHNVPCPASRIELCRLAPTGNLVSDCNATLEVHRLVPAASIRKLRVAAGAALSAAVASSESGAKLEVLCSGAVELGERTLQTREAASALEEAACSGSGDVVQLLLSTGIPATATSAQRAEKSQNLDLARQLLQLIPSSSASEASELVKALENQLPMVADVLLQERSEVLAGVPSADGAAVASAHAAGAWGVLAALLRRGDPIPLDAESLLECAVRAGRAELARVCLERIEEVSDSEACLERALRTCLDDGRAEFVREALEAQWRRMANQWSDGSGPALLAFEGGPADEPVECSICFDPLHDGAGLFVCAKGFRTCPHFFCVACSERVQDEATNKLVAWRRRGDARIPEPPAAACPMCRAPFASAVELPDPTVDPKKFFKLACVPGEFNGENVGHSTANPEQSELRLTEKAALDALCASLPVNPAIFGPRLTKELWPSWCECALAPDSNSCLAETDFLKLGGMLVWLSSHLMELKVDGQRGTPPSLRHHPAEWFKHFDYDAKAVLTKPELLRGIAKAYNVAMLAAPRTPARKARSVGIQCLRELVDVLWDHERWADGVTLEDFQKPSGLAERLLAVLPLEHGEFDCPSEELTVDEALAKARAKDFADFGAKEARAVERANASRNAARVAAKTRASSHPQSLPENQRDQSAPARGRGNSGSTANINQGLRRRYNLVIQCPSCRAVNGAVAAPGLRIMCGGCRHVFVVPRWAD